MENLIQKKEELLSRKGDVIHHQEKQRKGLVGSSLFSISVSRLSDNEVVIQISTYKFHKNPLSEILLHLEDDHGLLLMDASSFESSGGRLFYTLHLDQVHTLLIWIEYLFFLSCIYIHHCGAATRIWILSIMMIVKDSEFN